MLRAAVVALLALAFFDVSLPGRGPRIRVYLIDASSSVQARAARESFTPLDAARLVDQDLRAMDGSDQAAILAFGERPVSLVTLSRIKNVPVPTVLTGVQADATDLPAAIEAAIATAAGGDVVLFTDGRSTLPNLERAVELARARRVPIHTFALGPLGALDVRIRSIDAPATVPPAVPFRARISIESTGPWKGRFVAHAGGVERAFDLAFAGPSIQDIVLDVPAATRGSRRQMISMRLESTAPDACPENDRARRAIWIDDGRLRIHIAAAGPSAVAPLLDPERFDVQVEPGLTGAASADVVVWERLPASAVTSEELERLSRSIREGGTGLFALGGSSSYALGGFAGTALEDLLPLWAFPDERVALVILLDRSGSMGHPAPGRPRLKLDDAVAAITRALELVHPEDEVAGMSFADDQQTNCPLVPGANRGRVAAALRRLSAGNSTLVAPALREAAALARGSSAARRRILLVSDGETEEDENTIRAAAQLLAGENIKLVVAKTSAATSAAFRVLKEEGAEILDAHDFSTLDQTIAQALARTRELTAAPAEAVQWADDLFAGLSSPRPDRVNRVSPKKGAEAAARAGELPIVAFGWAGRGRTGASTLALEEGWAGELERWEALSSFLTRAIERVAPAGSGTPIEARLRFDGRHLEVTASLKGSERPDRLEARLQFQDGSTDPLELFRRGENLYEASVPARPGTVALRLGGRVVAAASRPHAPEFDAVGPDEETLHRIADRTGGRRVIAPSELARLERRGPETRRSSRVLFLALALVFFFTDLAAAVFLK